MTTVYTIGYGGRKISDFADILEKHGVNILIDIRRFPNSKNPDFKKGNLEIMLRKNGIEYFFLGEKLGGFRDGGFEKYMDTTDFMDGFKTLLDLTQKGTVAIMCMERKTKHCHRRFISRFLEDINQKLVHI